jgi:hypothetical protein
LNLFANENDTLFAFVNVFIEASTIPIFAFEAIPVIDNPLTITGNGPVPIPVALSGKFVTSFPKSQTF